MRLLKALLLPPVFVCALSFFLVSCSSTKRSSHGVPGGNGPAPSTAIQRKFGALMGVPASNISNGRLYEFIDKWLNTKYKYGSQNEKEIDCSGFTQILYDAVYSRKLPRNSEVQYNQATSKIRTAGNLREGDLIFFSLTKNKKVSHVGVYLQNNRFVNATNRGVVISDITLPYWQEGFVGGARLE